MSKYYRVKKDTFIWDKGAILKRDDELGNGKGGYQPVSDIWNANDHIGREYITSPIIESSPDWFERVYEVNLLTKVVYETKEKARKLLEKRFKE